MWTFSSFKRRKISNVEKKMSTNELPQLGETFYIIYWWKIIHKNNVSCPRFRFWDKLAIYIFFAIEQSYSLFKIVSAWFFMFFRFPITLIQIQFNA